MIKEEFKEKLKVKYDFYCELCNKYMQKKLQLVDVISNKLKSTILKILILNFIASKK